MTIKLKLYKRYTFTLRVKPKNAKKIIDNLGLFNDCESLTVVFKNKKDYKKAINRLRCL